MAGKRNRLKIGMLVASTNKLKNIQGKRLEIHVSYKESIFGNKILFRDVVGIRKFAY